MIERRLGGGRALFTDRHGGVSGGPYASMNLATHVGDDPGAVAENRRRAVSALLAEAPAVWPRHVHGRRVLHVGSCLPTRAEADGAVSTAPGVVLVAIGADCAPVALASDTAVGALHVGWRGLLAGVVDAGVGELRRSGTSPVHAVIGPTICAAHYPFGAPAGASSGRPVGAAAGEPASGAAALAAIVARFGAAAATRTASGEPALDLPAAIRLALIRAGARTVDHLGICTFESPDHFSYRRDGVTGRHAVLVTRA